MTSYDSYEAFSTFKFVIGCGNWHAIHFQHRLPKTKTVSSERYARRKIERKEREKNAETLARYTETVVSCAIHTVEKRKQQIRFGISKAGGLRDLREL